MQHESSRTKTRTIRIKNEAWEYFKGKPLNKVVEWVYDQVERGEIEIKGEEINILYKYNMWRYEKACRKVGVEPGLMLHNITKGIEKKAEEEKAKKAHG